MNDQLASKIIRSESSAIPAPTAAHRSGVYAKAHRDGRGGWGLVLLGLEGSLRTVALNDGSVVGSASRDARLDGGGVAPEHVRVSVRADGCYLEDLTSPDGLFVGGVRAQRIGVMHGDVVRLGQQLALFVEHDLQSYSGAFERTEGLVHGPRQRAAWVDPLAALQRAGSSICIEGPSGTGKRTLATALVTERQRSGPVVIVEGRTDGPRLPVNGATKARPDEPPAIWLVLGAERLSRAEQLEVAHAAGPQGGATVIATTRVPLDQALRDGLVAPWFASIFSGKRVALPKLEERREDIAAIVFELAARRGIAPERITPELMEAMVRAGWPGGVPEIDSALGAAIEADGDGPLRAASIAHLLTRPSSAPPSLPPAADPALARARLEDAMARANGSVASAARSLGMSRQAIYREADRLGLNIAHRKIARP